MPLPRRAPSSFGQSNCDEQALLAARPGGGIGLCHRLPPLAWDDGGGFRRHYDLRYSVRGGSSNGDRRQGPLALLLQRELKDTPPSAGLR